jgi:hypothetical protein
MTRFFGTLFLAVMSLLVFVFTAWGAGALWFALAGNGVVAAIAAGGFTMAGLAVLAGLFSTRWRRRALLGFACLFAGLMIWWQGIEPSNDRNWKPETALAPYATIEGDLVTMHNIRNFDYRTETDFTPAYYDRTFDLAKLNAVDVIASYWAGPDIAHIFVSFSFDDRDYLAVSIERRDEVGEGYSTVRGLFRQYELIYVAADERDLIRLRTNFRKDPPEEVYLYRVSIPNENLRRFFMGYIHKMNALREEPEFYNTLTTNCTSNIWLHTRANPGHVPYSWKVLLSGHVPELLYENRRITTDLPFDELRAQSRINDAALAAGDDGNFSRRIREGLPGMPF